VSIEHDDTASSPCSLVAQQLPVDHQGPVNIEGVSLVGECGLLLVGRPHGIGRRMPLFDFDTRHGSVTWLLKLGATYRESVFTALKNADETVTPIWCSAR